MVDTSNNPAHTQLKKGQLKQGQLDQRSDARSTLRSALLDKRMALTATQQVVAGTALLQQLKLCLTTLHSTDSGTGIVAGYLASRGEIDVTPALNWLRVSGFQTALPVISEINDAPGLLFAPFDQHTPLKPGKFGIPIPDIPESDYLSAVDLDLVLVPLVGFDARGGRLGMGGGYYDRTFAFRQQNTTPTANAGTRVEQSFIGVAHECQHVDNIPTESWDVSLQAIATDHTCYYPEI